MRRRSTFALAALVATLALPQVSWAEAISQRTLVHRTTTTVDLEVNSDSVICSSADYGGLFLKVLIPELAAITLLDHQNFGAGAPCVASGPCTPGNMPEDIFAATEDVEEVDIEVRAIREDYIDTDADTCNTSLTEEVYVTIGNTEFYHERWATLGPRLVADCVQGIDPDSVAPGSSDQTEDPEEKVCSDEDEQDDDEEKNDVAEEPAQPAEPHDAGCAVSSPGSGGAALLFLVALGLATRRRQSR